MLCGYLPYDDDPENPESYNINLLYKYILNTPLLFPDYISQDACDLMRLMLVPDPDKRGTMEEIMAHSWLVPHRQLFALSNDQVVPEIVPETKSNQTEAVQDNEDKAVQDEVTEDKAIEEDEVIVEDKPAEDEAIVEDQTIPLEFKTEEDQAIPLESKPEEDQTIPTEPKTEEDQTISTEPKTEEGQTILSESNMIIPLLELEDSSNINSAESSTIPLESIENDTTTDDKPVSELTENNNSIPTTPPSPQPSHPTISEQDDDEEDDPLSPLPTIKPSSSRPRSTSTEKMLSFLSPTHKKRERHISTPQDSILAHKFLQQEKRQEGPIPNSSVSTPLKDKPAPRPSTAPAGPRRKTLSLLVNSMDGKIPFGHRRQPEEIVPSVSEHGKKSAGKKIMDWFKKKPISKKNYLCLLDYKYSFFCRYK
jgi:serine/threonine protein kinase